MARCFSEKGITIVELLLVFTILAIFYAIFVPHYTKDAILEHKVYSTAHDLAADLRYARGLAMGGGTLGNPVTSPSAAVNNTLYFLQVYKSTGATATDTWKIYSYRGEFIKKSSALADVYIQEHATSSMKFDNRGVPYPVGGGYFIVRDTNSNYRWAVSVERGTGQVKLNQM